LAVELADNLLVKPRGSGRLPDVGDAIDQFIAVISGPREIVGVGVVLGVALEAVP